MTPCKICGYTTRSFHHPKLDKVYHRCQQCDFIFLDPKYYVSAQAEHKQYQQHNNSMENEGYVNMHKSFIAFINRYTPKKMLKVLDFGSGPGPVLAELFKEQGHDTAIYDLYFAADSSVFDQSYDLITSTEVIEHVKDPIEVYSNLLSCLNPKGYLALMTQFHPQDENAFCNWWYPRDPTHISFFSVETIKFLAQKLDIELIQDDSKSRVIFKKCS